MKSRISSSKATALRKDITRFAPLWVLYIVASILGLMTVINLYNNYSTPRDIVTTMQLMPIANFAYALLAAQLLFGFALIYVTLLINARQWKWTEGIMQIGRHSLWVLCLHSIEMSVFPWSVLWRFVDPGSVDGILAHFVLRSIGILVGCLVLRKGQSLLRKRKKQKKNG